MARATARQMTLMTLLLGLAVAAGALWAARHVFLEAWHLQRLDSDDPAKRREALEALAPVASHRAIESLVARITAEEKEERELALDVLENVARTTQPRHVREIVRAALDGFGSHVLYSLPTRGTWRQAASQTRWPNGVLVFNYFDFSGAIVHQSLVKRLSRWVREIPATRAVLADALERADDARMFRLQQILLAAWPASQGVLDAFLAAGEPRQVARFFRTAHPFPVRLYSIRAVNPPGTTVIWMPPRATLTDVATHFARRHERPEARAIALSFAALGPREAFSPLLQQACERDPSPRVREAAGRLARHLGFPVVELVPAEYTLLGDSPTRVFSSACFRGPTSRRQDSFDLWDGFRCDWLADSPSPSEVVLPPVPSR